MSCNPTQALLSARVILIPQQKNCSLFPRVLTPVPITGRRAQQASGERWLRTQQYGLAGGMLCSWQKRNPLLGRTRTKVQSGETARGTATVEHGAVGVGNCLVCACAYLLHRHRRSWEEYTSSTWHWCLKGGDVGGWGWGRRLT